MKTWTVKTVVGPDHKVAFKVPEDIPEGPVEIVVVGQPEFPSQWPLQKVRQWGC